MRIAIAGIGGVGGYFGGLLARQYIAGQHEIVFIAKGENEKAIKEKGFRIQYMNGDFAVRPFQVTNNPAEIADVDLLMCCTKGYDLETAMEQCRPCISEQTVILPLLNGVDAGERIEKIFPANEVWAGCVYLISSLVEPGFVKETGNIRKLFFGSDKGRTSLFRTVEEIFLNAGIDATWSAKIEETIWEKFLFISPVATATSYLDKTIEQVFSDDKSENLLKQLLDEINTVAARKGIHLPAGTTAGNVEKMRNLPPGTTTSMHRDFRKGGRTELDSLTGYVVRLADFFSVDTPLYKMMFESLKNKTTGQIHQ